MEELIELRSYIEQGRYTDALVLIGEMEEMSRDDKIQNDDGELANMLDHDALLRRALGFIEPPVAP